MLKKGNQHHQILSYVNMQDHSYNVKKQSKENFLFMDTQNVKVLLRRITSFWMKSYCIKFENERILLKKDSLIRFHLIPQLTY